MIFGKVTSNYVTNCEPHKNISYKLIFCMASAKFPHLFDKFSYRMVMRNCILEAKI